MRTGAAFYGAAAWTDKSSRPSTKLGGETQLRVAIGVYSRMAAPV
jgi:hypothetical protein